jgi:hypothetical protein
VVLISDVDLRVDGLQTELVLVHKGLPDQKAQFEDEAARQLHQSTYLENMSHPGFNLSGVTHVRFPVHKL